LILNSFSQADQSNSEAWCSFCCKQQIDVYGPFVESYKSSHMVTKHMVTVLRVVNLGCMVIQLDVVVHQSAAMAIVCGALLSSSVVLSHRESSSSRGVSAFHHEHE